MASYHRVHSAMLDSNEVELALASAPPRVRSTSNPPTLSRRLIDFTALGTDAFVMKEAKLELRRSKSVTYGDVEQAFAEASADNVMDEVAYDDERPAPAKRETAAAPRRASSASRTRTPRSVAVNDGDDDDGGDGDSLHLPAVPRTTLPQQRSASRNSRKSGGADDDRIDAMLSTKSPQSQKPLLNAADFLKMPGEKDLTQFVVPMQDDNTADQFSDDETSFADDVLTNIDDNDYAESRISSQFGDGSNPFKQVSVQVPAAAAEALDLGLHPEYWKFEMYSLPVKRRGVVKCALLAVFLMAMLANFVSVILQVGYSIGIFIRVMVETNFAPSPIWYTTAICYVQFVMALVFTTKSIDAPKLYAIVSYISGAFGFVFFIAIWYLAFDGVFSFGVPALLTYSMVGVFLMIFVCVLLHRKVSSLLSAGPIFTILFLPLTTVILPFYVITNFADMTWGGRGSVSSAHTVTNTEQLAIRLRIVTAFVVMNVIIVALVVFIPSETLVYVTLALVIFGYGPYLVGSILYLPLRYCRCGARRRKRQLRNQIAALPPAMTDVKELWIGVTCYNESESEIQGTLVSLMGLADTEELVSQHGYRMRVFILQDGRNANTRDTIAIITKFFMKNGAKQAVTSKYQLVAPDVDVWECTPRKEIDFYYMIKNKNRRKRDSQLLFMSLLFGKNKGKFGPSPPAILMLDMDTAIKSEAISTLYNRLLADPHIGGVCGHVVVRKQNCGFSQPLLMYQFFEFVVGHVIFKAAEDLCGFVTCLPGACTLFRVEALEATVNEYARIPSTIVQKNCLDQGEDRYLTTLLAIKGWKTAYEGHAEVNTSMFNDLEKFLEQRRRWQASTIANQIVVFKQMMRM